MREIFILNDSLLLSKILHVKDDNLVMVEHVQSDFAKLYFNERKAPRNLHTVIEAR